MGKVLLIEELTFKNRQLSNVWKSNPCSHASSQKCSKVPVVSRNVSDVSVGILHLCTLGKSCSSVTCFSLIYSLKTQEKAF